MAKRQVARPVYKRFTFWILVLLVLYTLAGFVVLPWWLGRQLPVQLEQQLGWQTTVGDVRLNPFAMTVEVSGLSATDSDEQPVLSWDDLTVDLGFWQLFRGVIAFDSITLDKPFVRIDLLKDYGVNLARDWSRHHPAATTEPSPPASQDSAPNLYFGHIELAGGMLRLRDFSQGTPAEFRITPLDLELNDLATYPRPGDSGYTLSAAIGKQRINWQGELSLSPFSSRGTLRVADIDRETIAHFAGPYLPYRLDGGQVTLSTHYNLSLTDGFTLTTDDGVINISDLALALPDRDQPPEMQVKSVSASKIGFDLNRRRLAVGPVAIAGAEVSLSRDADGQLNVMKPLSTADGPADPPEPTPASAPGAATPFSWTVGKVSLSDSQLHWQDQQPGQTARVDVSNIAVNLSGLSDQLADPVTYDASLVVGDAGTLSARGQTTLSPFTLEAVLDGSKLALAPFQPYLNQVAGVTIRDGSLSVNGKLNLDGQKQPMTGTFSGRGQVDGLDLRLPNSDAPLVSWQSLSLEPVEYNLSPARLEIGTLTLSKPMVNVARNEDGAYNLQSALAPATDKPASPSAKAQDTAAASDSTGAGFIFRISKLALDQGEIRYADRTLDPVFKSRLHQLDGSLTGLSNISPQRGKLDLTGKVDDLGALKIDGDIATLGSDEQTRLKVTLNDLGLPVLSPYFARYLGYRVDGGKLGLNLDYKIDGSRIDANNHVELRQMALGDAVASDQAVSAPVKLGLALLRDNDGRIVIELPIAGDLSQPDFQIGQVVMRTFVNLIVKAATSPFSILGSVADLAGLSGAELSEVHFAPGRATLPESEQKKLAALAKALKARSKLILSVRGAATPALDGPALKRQTLFQALGITPAMSQTQRIDRLEQRYRRVSTPKPLPEFKQATRAAEGGTLSDQAWEQALVGQLTDDKTVSGEALQDLAGARSSWIQRQLQDTYDVQAKQLFVRDPVTDAQAGKDGEVAVRFELKAG